MNYLDLKEARDVYAAGGNVTDYLKSKFNTTNNTSEIIEIAYDLQAGSYIENLANNIVQQELYTTELCELLTPHLEKEDSILHVGAGELITISLICDKLYVPVNEIFALDISWSRLFKGIGFWNETVNKTNLKLSAFVADIKRIPLASKSIDVVTSSHSLEPNGAELGNLLRELFRVAKRKCILFEPSYEHNSDEGRERMDRLGYIKNIAGETEKLGGRLLDVILIKNRSSPLNPTACFVIEPPESETGIASTKAKFTIPGGNALLARDGDFYVSQETGLVFPILKSIPVLKQGSAILASALFI